MKILSGLVKADAGDIGIDGRVVRFHGAREAMEAGLAMIHHPQASRSSSS